MASAKCRFEDAREGVYLTPREETVTLRRRSPLVFAATEEKVHESFGAGVDPTVEKHAEPRAKQVRPRFARIRHNRDDRQSQRQTVDQFRVEAPSLIMPRPHHHARLGTLQQSV